MKELLARLWLISISIVIVYLLYNSCKVLLLILGFAIVVILAISITIHCIEVISGDDLANTTRKYRGK